MVYASGEFLQYERTMLLAVLSSLKHEEGGVPVEHIQTLIVKATRPSPVRAFLKRYGRRARRRAAPAR